MNELIEQYIGNVTKELYNLVQAEHYISDLRTNLEEYMQQFPDSTYSDLVEQFGTPESVAKDYIDNQKPYSPKERAKHRTKTRLITIFALIIIACLLCFVIALSGAQQLYYNDTTTIIEDIEVQTE